uniref:Glycosyl transferase family 28 C-terminal domain-containing protein n=1 Tax=Cryptomonas curvata TaxID=233186 RepID=A0A7S0MXJ1_9CRYP|mmetsp:Transcript_55932/g.117035  ORF Transcript_55932/g.117035 Transcript_55932/m.117035 type:complete len:166 (+) Transcript_55932:87-584(+)
MGKIAFVTVGTTKFDALVKALDTDFVQQALVAQGFSTLLIQRGKSEHEPKSRVGNSLDVHVYEYKPSLKPDAESADLIISHAGAGSVLEALRLRKTLIVVANESLMDNHQQELAAAMSEQGWLFTARPDTLASVISEAHASTLRPLEPLNLIPFKNHVMEAMGLL